MFAVPDAFAAFYLICFLVGLLFIVISALLGLVSSVENIPRLNHGAHVDGFDSLVGHTDVGAGHGEPDVGHHALGGHNGHTGDGSRAATTKADEATGEAPESQGRVS